MKIKNLSQLKKVMQTGTLIKVHQHAVHPDYEGQLRVVNKVQTNCTYQKLYQQPDADFSTCNGGRGNRMDFGAAINYRFGDDGLILWYSTPHTDENPKLIMVFEVLTPDELVESRVYEDQFGICHCGKCDADLVCNECGNMPDICLKCGIRLDWSYYSKK